MTGLGFTESQGSGSRVSFSHPDNPEHIVKLHKTHGRNPPTVNVVYLRELAAKLKEWGYLQ